MNQMIERGDIVALKSGKEAEVQSVRYDGERLVRFDYVVRMEESPMRRTAYPSDLLRLLRKNPRKMGDPKAMRPADALEPVHKVVVVQKTEEGYKLPDSNQVTPTKEEGPIPLNPAVNGGHEAIAHKPKPVVTRIKKTSGR